MIGAVEVDGASTHNNALKQTIHATSQLAGLDALADSLPPVLVASLLTRLIDLVDGLVEKYAVFKVRT